MINIEIPKVDVSIERRKQQVKPGEAIIPSINGFIDLHQIPRDKGGIFMFYNIHDELLFVGRASECAEFLGYTAIQSFYALASRSKHKRRNTYYILKEELKDE